RRPAAETGLRAPVQAFRRGPRSTPRSNRQNELHPAGTPALRAVAQPLRLAAGVTRRAPRTRQQTRGAAATSHRTRAVLHPRGRISMSMLNFVKSFVRDEEGQDLLEYALLVALIALIAIGSVGFA